MLTGPAIFGKLIGADENVGPFIIGRSGMFSALTVGPDTFAPILPLPMTLANVEKMEPKSKLVLEVGLKFIIFFCMWCIPMLDAISQPNSISGDMFPRRQCFL